MTSIGALKVPKTCAQFINSLFQFIAPSLDLDPLMVGLINYLYLETSKKAVPRDVLGLSDEVLKLTRVSQNILQDMECQEV